MSKNALFTRPLAMAALFAVAAAAARAETLRVPADYPTIQAALTAAQDGDDVLVADGVYRGPHNRGLNFRGRAVVLRSENGPANCTIDCSGQDYGIVFDDRETLATLVDGFTITRAGMGFSGIFCQRSSPTIRNCIISEGAGPAIECICGATPAIEDCALVDNRVGVDDFENQGAGLASYSGSTPVLTRCQILKNRTVRGGGVAVDGGHAVLRDCVIRDNEADFGGGVFVDRDIEDGSITLERCSVVYNTAHVSIAGGAMYVRSGGAVLVQCDISYNKALGNYNRIAGIYSEGR